jgi:hypothetical protein
MQHQSLFRKSIILFFFLYIFLNMCKMVKWVAHYGMERVSLSSHSLLMIIGANISEFMFSWWLFLYSSCSIFVFFISWNWIHWILAELIDTNIVIFGAITSYSYYITWLYPIEWTFTKFNCCILNSRMDENHVLQ